MEDQLNGAPRQTRRPRPVDPVAGLRAMADIQAEGLRAASELLDRVLDRGSTVYPPADGNGDGEYTSVLDAWAELLERFAAGLAAPAAGAPAQVRLGVDAVAAPLRIHWKDGEGSEAAFDLHNETRGRLGPLRLHCGVPMDPEGATLHRADVHFEPEEIEELPAGASCRVTLALSAVGAPSPGTYRGTIQAAGAPSLWVPLEVSVERC